MSMTESRLEEIPGSSQSNRHHDHGGERPFVSGVSTIKRGSVDDSTQRKYQHDGEG